MNLSARFSKKVQIRSVLGENLGKNFTNGFKIMQDFRQELQEFSHWANNPMSILMIACNNLVHVKMKTKLVESSQGLWFGKCFDRVNLEYDLLRLSALKEDKP